MEQQLKLFEELLLEIKYRFTKKNGHQKTQEKLKIKFADSKLLAITNANQAFQWYPKFEKNYNN